MSHGLGQLVLIVIIICVLVWVFKTPLTKITWRFLHRKHLKKDLYVDKCFLCKELKRKRLKEQKGGD